MRRRGAQSRPVFAFAPFRVEPRRIGAHAATIIGLMLLIALAVAAVMVVWSCGAPR